jgi:Na+/proline symporter
MYFLLIVYLIFILYLSIKEYDNLKSDSSYFFSSYKTKTHQSFLSIFVTETSVATILIFPAVGYSKNFNIIFLCFGYIIGRIVVALLYLKYYHKISTLSLYEFITHKESKKFLSFAYLLAKYISGSVRFYLAGYGLYQLTGLSIEFWLVFILFVIGIYSLTGGLKSVILTDVVQGIIILLSSILIFYFLSSENQDLFVSIKQVQFDLKTSIFLFLGSILLTISSHGGDQDILQRVFSIADLKEAQKSLIISGFLASFVIMIFVLIGYLLTNQQLDKNSPLLDFINKLDSSFSSLIIKNIFIVVLNAAAMSTLDSSIHSTGAIWKSILKDFNKNYANYIYSLISLIIMFLLSFLFIYSKTNKDFLSFALGSMNYINGTLFASITMFVIYKNKLNRNTVLIILITNIITTLICEYYSLYFALTTIISFSITFLLGWISIKKS